MSALDINEITELLKRKTKTPAPTPPKEIAQLPPQTGPLRYYDKERICLNSGYYAIDTETNERYWKKTKGKCGSPTHWELDGIPYCTTHVLYKMNEKIMELQG